MCCLYVLLVLLLVEVGREWHGFTSKGSQNHVSEMFEVRVDGAMREDLGFLNQIVGLDDSAILKVHSTYSWTWEVP